jgi:hypothetical protein
VRSNPRRLCPACISSHRSRPGGPQVR